MIKEEKRQHGSDIKFMYNIKFLLYIIVELALIKHKRMEQIKLKALDNSIHFTTKCNKSALFGDRRLGLQKCRKFKIL